MTRLWERGTALKTTMQGMAVANDAAAKRDRHDLAFGVRFVDRFGRPIDPARVFLDKVFAGASRQLGLKP